MGVNEKKRRGGKKARRARAPDELAVEVGRLFGRRPTSLWSAEEAELWARVAPGREEVELVVAAYSAEGGKRFLRRTVRTLLLHWTEECDFARQRLEKKGGLPPGEGRPAMGPYEPAEGEAGGDAPIPCPTVGDFNFC